MTPRDQPIIAIATPAGRGGIGVVRISFGRWTAQPVVAAFIAALCGRPDHFRLAPRYATLVGVDGVDGALIDRGIALLFVAPHSYTAEDVLELQLHGGPVVLQMVVARCLAVGETFADVARMRLAEPGEFTERAFLNDKLDLAQAEAVADLIEASSEAAVLGAQASLSGAFSAEVRALVDQLIALRALVEATLDFPEEEIDFLERSDARGRLERACDALASLTERARRGALLREGLTVVLVGRTNVGKSSLLNALAESDVAIVTPIAGTTRDRVEQVIRLEGIALHIVDTAGIRELDDNDGDAETVERIGIARTWEAVERAHVVLHLVDVASLTDADRPEDEAIARRLPSHAARRTIVNKIDLTGDEPRIEPALDRDDDIERIWLSAKTGAGVDLLRHELLAIAGWQPSAETGFVARERHLLALRAAASHLDAASAYADAGDRQLDLFAEELRLAQIELDRITGAFSADDLLGEIFGKFCIGK
ncbi:MAG: tRNA uridine-5-carboxymethylaminomethyl(34) synthesis GTPase MnmE [Burkholderiaceae bacterium]